MMLDSADTNAASAAEMGKFLKTSAITETKAFVELFAKEIVVKPGKAAIVTRCACRKTVPKEKEGNCMPQSACGWWVSPAGHSTASLAHLSFLTVP